MKPILFIHPRRGLFQLTSCNTCHYKFGCDNCDCNLTTYRSYETNLQLLCHQCQTFYNFPKVCPMCKGSDISINFGGVDELVEVLKKDFDKEVIKVDSKSTIDYDPTTIYVTTRVFDPSLEYSRFSSIIFIHAENLMASPDYLVNEDVHRSLVELFLQVDHSTQVVFDTANPDLPFFQELAKLNSANSEGETYSESFDMESNPPEEIFRVVQDDEVTEDLKPSQNANSNIIDWYTNFVQEESINRQKFLFPPFQNLILLTTQERTREKSIQKINSARQYLFGYKNELGQFTIGTPYQAKFLKRKGMFSHHLLIKFPRQYSNYFQLRDIVKSAASTFNLQARLNPRHLF
jgi:primosomal protein N'